jgi:hypothetical protein
VIPQKAACLLHSQTIDIVDIYPYFTKPYLSPPQTMDIADLAIRLVVCQKSDFHGNRDFQNFQKLDPLQTAAKKFWSKYASLSKIF